MFPPFAVMGFSVYQFEADAYDAKDFQSALMHQAKGFRQQRNLYLSGQVLVLYWYGKGGCICDSCMPRHMLLSVPCSTFMHWKCRVFDVWTYLRVLCMHVDAYDMLNVHHAHVCSCLGCYTPCTCMRRNSMLIVHVDHRLQHPMRQHVSVERSRQSRGEEEDVMEMRCVRVTCGMVLVWLCGAS